MSEFFREFTFYMALAIGFTALMLSAKALLPVLLSKLPGTAGLQEVVSA